MRDQDNPEDADLGYETMMRETMEHLYSKLRDGLHVSGSSIVPEEII
jgi:hypothetical protein